MVRRAAMGLLVVAALMACSSQPSADQWATQVCGALSPWRAEITALNAKAATEMSAATTSAQTRDNLVQLVTGAETASESARAEVARAGVPDVDGGGQVAESFLAALVGSRDAYARARTDLMALPTTDDKVFYDGVVAVMGRLNTDYAASAADLDSVSSPELKRAFDGLPACH